MTQARQNIVSLSDTPYYHCMGRCVRRAFLCGEDSLTGMSYEHRKQWIVDKLKELSQVYLIDICAYAVMSNHYHLVLKVNKEQADTLSEDEVIERWTTLFKGNVLIERYKQGSCTSQSEIDKAKECIEIWRERLYDLSWFMRCLNESISRKANEEDKCSGHFWEGRFKSQALLNEQALLSCMAYVDLNPIRADLAESLDGSEFTSIEQRMRKSNGECLIMNGELKDEDLKQNLEQKSLKLADFVGGKQIEGIPYRLMDYLELVDWTGRAIRDDKKGYIDEREPRILDKLGFSADIWLKSVGQFSDHFYSHIGTEDQLKTVCLASEKKWIAGIKQSREFISN